MEIERIESVWIDGLSPLTVKYYRRDLRRFGNWLLVRKLDLLPCPPIEEMVHFLNTVPQTPGMKEQAKLVLRSFYRFCAENGYIEKNTARFLRLAPPKNTIAERIPTLTEVRAVVAAASSLNPFLAKRNQLICEFAFITGARRAEIAGVLRTHLQETQKGLQVQLFGKGSKKRWVLLPKEFAERLVEWTRHGFLPLFPRIDGSQISAAIVGDVVKKASIRAGRPAFSTHWFRHAHASESIANGCPLNVVQVTLGHSNVATTSRYLHVRPDTSSALYLSINPVHETTILVQRKNQNEVSEQSNSVR